MADPLCQFGQKCHKNMDQNDRKKIKILSSAAYFIVTSVLVIIQYSMDQNDFNKFLTILGTFCESSEHLLCIELVQWHFKQLINIFPILLLMVTQVTDFILQQLWEVKIL